MVDDDRDFFRWYDAEDTPFIERSYEIEDF